MAGLVALITGANRGIGHQLAHSLAARGPVIGTSRGAMPTDEPAVRWMSLDVTDPESHNNLARDLDGAPLPLLVCNAGVYLDKAENLADGFGAQLWAETFAANVTGVFLTIQALLPNLQAAETAKIAIISSKMGSTDRAPGGSYIYRASKAAALNLGRNLASDLHDLGIAVGVYHPGWVRTDMGGPSADIGLEESATGLVARFDALSLDTTGCFETFDGTAIPF